MTWKFLLLISSSSSITGMTSQRAMGIAIYSVSVVESATWDCNLDAQIIGHRA
jgi:hypothetical protein